MPLLDGVFPVVKYIRLYYKSNRKAGAYNHAIQIGWR